MDGRTGTHSNGGGNHPPARRVDVAIVGGGVSGLSAAFEIGRRRPELSLTVLEAAPSPGGKVRSDSEEGYTFDWGPNGFMPAPDTLALVDLLGLTESLVPASPDARSRYIYRDGGLRKVPVKPPEFLASEILSPAGKVRAALEPLLFSRAGTRLLARNGGAGDRGDESVYRFAERHFGREVAELASTLVLGITAGDARRLSVASLFPALHEQEVSHGSIVRALLSARRQNAGSQSRRPALSSFSGGMGVLTETLAQHLGDAVVTACEVTGLTRNQSGEFELEFTRGGTAQATGQARGGAEPNGYGSSGGSSGSSFGSERILAKQVVLCTPPYVSARLLEHLLPPAAAALAQIACPDVDVFALGFDRIDVPNALAGFGFLVPRGEGVRSLGVLWTSALYPQRSPAGCTLLRVIAGGALDPSLPQLPDDEALAVVARDLRLTMGITAAPRFVRRLRFPQAIPQYELGHRERVERALSSARQLRGVYLGGNALFGVGVNDCIRDAKRLADEVLA